MILFFNQNYITATFQALLLTFGRPVIRVKVQILMEPELFLFPILLSDNRLWLMWKLIYLLWWPLLMFYRGKEIRTRISLEGMMLKLKVQYFGHLMRRVDSLEKTLMLGGIVGRRKRG